MKILSMYTHFQQCLQIKSLKFTLTCCKMSSLLMKNVSGRFLLLEQNPSFPTCSLPGPQCSKPAEVNPRFCCSKHMNLISVGHSFQQVFFFSLLIYFLF